MLPICLLYSTFSLMIHRNGYILYEIWAWYQITRFLWTQWTPVSMWALQNDWNLWTLTSCHLSLSMRAKYVSPTLCGHTERGAGESIVLAQARPESLWLYRKWGKESQGSCEEAKYFSTRGTREMSGVEWHSPSLEWPGPWGWLSGRPLSFGLSTAHSLFTAVRCTFAVICPLQYCIWLKCPDSSGNYLASLPHGYQVKNKCA